MLKNTPANTGDSGVVDSIPGLGRSPGEGHGHPLQYSCLENPMDRGAWQAMVHGVTKSWTLVKQLSTHRTYTYNRILFKLLKKGNSDATTLMNLKDILLCEIN